MKHVPCADLTNGNFGLWTARWPAGRRSKKVCWLCTCKCGRLGIVQGQDLVRGSSSGCRFCTNCIHGNSRKPEYQAFRSARSRCTNKNDQAWKDYGGRGIKFLFNSYEQFIGCIGPKPSGLTLDRINNDGHYEPGNVRWATYSQQARNRRKRANITPCHRKRHPQVRWTKNELKETK